MKKIKVKQIFGQLLMAVVVIGFMNISAHAKSIKADDSETYDLGNQGHVHISLEHYKEKKGYTPVLISTGGLKILKWMAKNGSVVDTIAPHPGYQSALFRVDLDGWQILSGKEIIPCEITVQDSIRTRLRINGEQAKAVVIVETDHKNGEFFLFKNPVKLAKLHLKRGETARSKEEVKIFGADIAGTGKFILEKETKTIYTLQEYKRIHESKERANRKAPTASLSQGKVIPGLERQALIALYNSTSGDSWDDKSGWKEPPLEPDGFAAIGSEGTWYGITVASDHVTEIDLSRNNLAGTIPIELGNFSNLQDLRLDWNSLSGSIPPELGNLSNLQALDLGYNLLSGSIPGELGNFNSLWYLSLEDNLLSGSIPPELGNLSSLEFLRLEDNLLSGSIPPELGDLGNLVILFLNENSLSGSIPAELSNLSNLTELLLFSNYLSGTIPPGLGNLSNLQTLGLCDNSLSGSIPPEIGNLGDLQSLWLDWNSLSGSIPPELGNLSYLTELYLSDNQLSGSIPFELGNLGDLEDFIINSSKLSGEIPTSLTNLTNLYYTNIGFNALYTNDGALITFLNQKDPDWSHTQTIAPTGVSAAPYDATSIRVSWTLISYCVDPGGYRVFYSTTPGGPYTFYDTTSSKGAAFLTVTGLTPGTGYYFVVQTRTEPHSNNQNTVDSEYSMEAAVDGNQDINVKYKNKNIPSGSTLNGGRRHLDKIIGHNIPFTIQNLGFLALDLTGSPDMVTLSGPGAKFFMVSQQPLTGILAPGESTTFKIRTIKTTVPDVPDGWQKDIEFTVSIPSTDPDENPYTFTITMTVIK